MGGYIHSRKIETSKEFLSLTAKIRYNSGEKHKLNFINFKFDVQQHLIVYIGEALA